MQRGELDDRRKSDDIGQQCRSFNTGGQMSRVVVSSMLLILCGCQTALRHVAGSRDDDFARVFIHSLHTGSKSDLTPLFSPRLARMPGLADSVSAVEQLFPSGAIEIERLIGVHASKPAGGGASWHVLTYELRASGGYAIVTLTVADELGHSFIDGVHILPVPDSAIARTAFTAANASAGGVVALLLAGALAVFCLVTAIRVLRSRMPRSWLWAAASLIGVGGLAVPWSGGTVGLQWMSVYVLSAALSRGEIGSPWYLLLSFPIGALVAESRRQQHLKREGWWAAVLPWHGSSLGEVGRSFVPKTDPITIPMSSRQFVAGVEILGGIAGIVTTAYIWHEPNHPDNRALWGSIIIALFSVAAGILLWRGTRLGLASSRLLQGSPDRPAE